MGRRKYILHQYASDRVKESFGRMRSRKEELNQSQTTAKKVSKTFLLVYDRYIAYFAADKSIMMERKKKGK